MQSTYTEKSINASKTIPRKRSNQRFCAANYVNLPVGVDYKSAQQRETEAAKRIIFSILGKDTSYLKTAEPHMFGRLRNGTFRGKPGLNVETKHADDGDGKEDEKVVRKLTTLQAVQSMPDVIGKTNSVLEDAVETSQEAVSVVKRMENKLNSINESMKNMAGDFKKLWQSPRARATVGAFIVGAMVKKLMVFLRKSDFQVVSVFNTWISATMSFLPIEGAARLWEDVRDRLGSLLGKLNTTTLSELSLENAKVQAFTYVSAALTAIGGCIMMNSKRTGSNSKESKLSYFLNLVKEIGKFTAGMKTIRRAGEWFLSKMPNLLQTAAFSWLGLGKMDPGVAKLWDEAQGLIYEASVGGPGFWSLPSAKPRVRSILDRMCRFTGRAGPNSLTAKIMENLRKELRAVVPADISAHKPKAFSQLSLTCMGPPGLGKTVCAAMVAQVFAKRSEDSTWYANCGSDYDDGLVDQPVKVYDDEWAVKTDKDGVKLQKMLADTSCTISYTTQADLKDKSRGDPCQFRIVTGNFTLEWIKKNSRYPLAILRRMLVSGLCLLFEVREEYALGTNRQQPDYNKIKAAPAERLKNWDHVRVYVIEYDDRMAISKREISSFKEATLLLLRKWKVARDNDYAIHQNNFWKQSGMAHQAVSKIVKDYNMRTTLASKEQKLVVKTQTGPSNVLVQNYARHDVFQNDSLPTELHLSVESDDSDSEYEEKHHVEEKYFVELRRNLQGKPAIRIEDVVVAGKVNPIYQDIYIRMVLYLMECEAMGKVAVPTDDEYNWDMLNEPFNQLINFREEIIQQKEDEQMESWYEWSLQRVPAWDDWKQLPGKLLNTYHEWVCKMTSTDANAGFGSTTITTITTVAMFSLGYSLSDDIMCLADAIRQKCSAVLDFSTGKDDEKKVVVIMDQDQLARGEFLLNAEPHSIGGRRRVAQTTRKVPNTRFSAHQYNIRKDATLLPNAMSHMDHTTSFSIDNQYVISHIAKNIALIESNSGNVYAIFSNCGQLSAPSHSLAVSPFLFEGKEKTEGIYDFDPPSPGISRTYFPAQWLMVTYGQGPNKRKVKHYFDPKGASLKPYYPIGPFADQKVIVDHIQWNVKPGAGFRPMKKLVHLLFINPDWSALSGIEVFMVFPAGECKYIGKLSVAEDSVWMCPSRDTQNRIAKRGYLVGMNSMAVIRNPAFESKEGYCGLPYIIKFDGRIYWIGQHLGLYSTGKSEFMGVLLQQDDFVPLPQPILTTKNVTKYLPDAKAQLSPFAFHYDTTMMYDYTEITKTVTLGGMGTAIGLVDKREYVCTKQKIFPGPLKDAPSMKHYFVDHKTIPTNMSMPMQERLGALSVTKPLLRLNWRELHECFLDTIRRWGANSFEKQPSVMACAAGNTHPDNPHTWQSPMNTKTSPGIRWRTKNSLGKKAWFNTIEGEKGPYIEPKPELVEAILRLMDEAYDGKIGLTPMGAFYKDEATKESKKSRPRVIRSFDLAKLCLYRVVFDQVLSTFYSKAPGSESFVGSNPESRDWDNMVKRLTAMAGNTNLKSFIGVDVKGLDESHRFSLFELMIVTILSMFKDKEHNKMRFYVFMSQFLRTEIVGSLIFLIWGYLPSGTPWTTILNILLLLGLLKYAYLQHCRQSGDVTTSCKNMASMEHFHRCVVMVAYGDDLLGSINRKLTTFGPEHFVLGAFDDVGTKILELTSPAKDGPPCWMSINQVEFLSRGIGFNRVPIVGVHFSPMFKRSRFVKSALWFRKGPLSLQELTSEKLNGLLLLMAGHGYEKFTEIRNDFVDAVEHLGFDIRLRTFRDCIEIWRRPEIQSQFLSSCVIEFKPKTTFLPSAEPHMNAIKTVLDGASNVTKIVGETIDELKAAPGKDNLNIGLNPPRFVASDLYLMNGNGNITNFQQMAMNPKPTRKNDPSLFGQTNTGTTLEELCKPTYYGTFEIATTDGPGVILGHGFLTPCPKTALARLGDHYQPLACGFMALKFNTWRADFVITLDFIIPAPANTRCGFAFLPGVYNLPETVEQIQSTYVHYFDVKQGDTSFNFRIPYQSNTPRKYVPNGPPDSSNSMGIWVLYVYNSLMTTASTAQKFDINMFFGLENVVLDNFGLRNFSVNPVPYDTVEEKKVKSKQKETTNAGFVRVYRRETQLLSTAVPHSSKGVTFQENSSPPSDGKKPQVGKESSLATTENETWSYQDMAMRPQLVGSFDFNTSHRVGDVLLTMEFPFEGIVGTHRQAWVRFIQMVGGVCHLTIKCQGLVFAAGAVCLSVYPTVPANDAVRLSESKVTQTFVSHKFIKPSDVSGVTLAIPYSFWLDAFTLDSPPYASMVARVFNQYAIGEDGPDSVTFSVFSEWRGLKFAYINPNPTTWEERLNLVRKNFLARNQINNKPILKTADRVEYKQKSDKKFVISRKRRKSKYIHAVPHMMDPKSMENADEVHNEAKVTMATSTKAYSLDPVNSVNELCKRFSPIYFEAGSNMANKLVSFPILEIFAKRMPNSLRQQTMSFFGSMFAGFVGTIRIAVSSFNLRDTTIMFVSEHAITEGAFSNITGSPFNTAYPTVTSSGFAPFAKKFGSNNGQMGVVTNWTSIQKFARLDKFSRNDSKRRLNEGLGGIAVMASGNLGGNQNLTLMAAFSDGSSFGLPMCVPRLAVAEDNIGDQYPASEGFYRIGEYLDFEHKSGGPAPATSFFTQETLALAETSIPLQVQVPYVEKSQAQSFRMPSYLFSLADLQTMGLQIPDDATLTVVPELRTKVSLDLTGVMCIPVVTTISFDTGAQQQLNAQPANMYVEVIGSLGGRKISGAPPPTGDLVFFTGTSASILPPWQQGYLTDVWDIKTSELAVPTPAVGIKVFDPTASFSNSPDPTIYGILTQEPPICLVATDSPP